MHFVYDPDKSAANLLKHGIDFDRAQRLWQDPDLVEAQARTMDEPRWLVLARLDGLVWAAIVTRRGGAIRIISVRRARPREVELYEGA